MDRFELQQLEETIVIHPTCSNRKAVHVARMQKLLIDALRRSSYHIQSLAVVLPEIEEFFILRFLKRH